MPIYTYRCKNCGVQFDEHQKFSDPPLTHCPECEKDTLQKVFQPVGIVFKGSGFYATDHRSPSGAGRSSSKSSDSDSKTNNTSSNSESKSSSESSSTSKSES